MSGKGRHMGRTVLSGLALVGAGFATAGPSRANETVYRTTCFYFDRPTTRHGEQACTVSESGSKSGYTVSVTLSDGARYSETVLLEQNTARFKGVRSIFAGPFADAHGRFTCAGLEGAGRKEICFYIGKADILFRG